VSDLYSLSTTEAGELTAFVPFDISKRDDDERMVYGYASTADEDSQGDRIDVQAMADALPDYMRFGNIREMHQASAVGKAIKADVDAKGTYLSAKIVDDVAWKKVKEGVYNGFSIGGRVTKREGASIKGIKLVEISLVDRPANPATTFDLYKCDDATNTTTAESADTVTSTVTVTEVIEIAKADTPAAIDREAEYLRRASAMGIDQSPQACLKKRNGYSDVLNPIRGIN